MQLKSTDVLSAAAAGNIDEIKKWLELGAEIESVNGAGSTALILAAENGHVHAVEYLVQRGANLEHRNIDRRTALDCAIAGGCAEVCDVLLSAGASRPAFWPELINNWNPAHLVNCVLGCLHSKHVFGKQVPTNIPTRLNDPKVIGDPELNVRREPRDFKRPRTGIQKDGQGVQRYCTFVYVLA